MPSKIIPFSKLDLQTRYATLHARGFTVVGGTFVNCSSKLLLRHKCGYEWTVRFDHVNRGK